MQGEEVRESAMKHILMTVVSATFGALSNLFVQCVDFLLKLPDICDKLEAENLKMKANFAALREYPFAAKLPGKVPSARMQSSVVSAMNEEEVKSFSDFYDFLELPTLGKLWTPRRHPLVISCELEKGSPRLKITLNGYKFVYYSLDQGAPAGHESAETPIGHESTKATSVTHNLLKHLSKPRILNKLFVNLSKVVGDFVGDQKSINVQLNHRIDSVESTLNKNDGWDAK
ncbi:hypothetical protein CK203_094300 [Vitis vinifera]|uniref:Uncharacterized protein n=1 Tax=Vitis vinifera TaxID=29760 RepID=A0A438DZE6_VITVI|nr:hypothetical protein CK203_094300 [Vitis vinifera]